MNALIICDAFVHSVSRRPRYGGLAWSYQAYEGVMSMRTFRKVIAGAVFALACSGSVAAAGPIPPCDLPCWKAYQACLSGGGDAMECQYEYDRCIMERCGAV
jgi:hypothetical protein